MNKRGELVCLILVLSRVVLTSQTILAMMGAGIVFTTIASKIGALIGNLIPLLNNLDSYEKVDVVSIKLEETVKQAEQIFIQTKQSYQGQQLPPKIVSLFDEFRNHISQVRVMIEGARVKLKVNQQPQINYGPPSISISNPPQISVSNPQISVSNPSQITVSNPSQISVSNPQLSVSSQTVTVSNNPPVCQLSYVRQCCAIIKS